MDLFKIYFQLGFEHISDIKGYDHILFIIVMCVIFSLKEWKRILILVTAFTIGHSLTLALAALEIIRFPRDWAEFLIPVTIMLTALSNVVLIRKENQKLNLQYLIVAFFGLIHGLGFSNFLISAMTPRGESIRQLLAFNIGVEVGQLLIVALYFLMAFVFLNLLKVPHKKWILFISGAAFGIALVLALESDLLAG